MGTVKLLIFIVVYLLVVVRSADVLPKLIGVIRDQAPNAYCTDDAVKKGWDCGNANRGKGFSGTDFELSNGYSNNEKGLVGDECKADGSNIRTCGRLTSETDPTPKYIFSGQSPQKNIQSPASFYNWFHNSAQTTNVNYTLPLEEYQGVYRFNSNSFFPIDNKGWKDTAMDHNFGFCLEAHTRFGYRGGEIFYFSGDDDVWVYINNYLVIDLGALHPMETKNLDVDSVARAIGLVKGKSYRLDFFYCERHTDKSNLMLSTSMDLYCAYTDACGVCEGTGQSCCAAGSCDDRNACTDDTCDVMVRGKCVHTNSTCPTASTKCKQAFCDSTRGCQERDLVCDDSNACTTDSCSLASGCTYSAPCPDIGKCQVGTCLGKTQGCQYTTRQCPASTDKCSEPVCTEANGCGFRKKSCDDGNPCTQDSCNPSTGACINDATAVCNDGDLCTKDSCDRSTGKAVCSFVSNPCGNGEKCLNSKCDPKTGICNQSPVVCATDACHIPACSNTTGCQSVEKKCDDGNACTRDTCDPKVAGGCVFTDITGTCNDGNACTKDTCDIKLGCLNTPIPYDDSNACTLDACDRTAGISHTNITAQCDDNDVCTDNSCNAKTGCIYTKRICDDGNPCTTDSCTSAGNKGCTYTTIPNCVAGCTRAGGAPCTATDKCYPATCTLVGGVNTCSNMTVDCNDNNACTTDSCSGGECRNAPITCTPNPCQTATCDKVKGCVYAAITCNDNNPCTNDQCQITGSTYTCSNTLVDKYCSTCNNSACSYSDPCKPKVCQSNKCTETNYDCDDNNACTNSQCSTDSDGKAKCSYTDVRCSASSNACTPNVCDTKAGCQPTPVNCTSNDLCQIGSCSVNGAGAAVCSFAPVVCNNSNPCLPEVCQAGQCVVQPVVCNDNIPCTKDTCAVINGAATCVAPDNCPLDNCGPMACNRTSGICQAGQFDCDDRNPCTDDVLTCANNSYNCSYLPSSYCDDNNLCTNEVCDGQNVTSPCSYEQLSCLPRNICEVVPADNKCDPKVGCVYEPFVCPGSEDRCKVIKCDTRAGCVTEDYICPGAPDPGCFKPACNSNATAGTDPCSIVAKDGWGSKYSTNGVLCALRYDDTVRNAAIGTGAAVGIGIGAAAAAGFIGYGGKKGYDHWKNMQNQRFNGVQNNPLYETSEAASDNPLYRHSTTL